MDNRKRVLCEFKEDGFQGQKAIIIPRKVLEGSLEENLIVKPLYITDIGYYPNAKFHFRDRPNGSEQNILICCEKGRGRVQILESDYEVNAGEFVVIPAGKSHTYKADDSTPWSIYWVHFKGDVAYDMVELVRKRVLGLKGILYDTRKSFKIFMEIYGQLENGYSSNNLMLSNMYFWHFLTSCIFGNEGEFASRDGDITKNAIDTAIEFFKVNIDKQLTLQDVADVVNLSPSHFSFLFKNKTGFSPIEYFNHLKIQKACQYLLFTDNRIKEISFQLGIDDQYYFSRLFKKVMGVSPEEYRNKRKA
ncbi:MAG: AraC family transcriptional regulator [Emticicia sp.]|nr:AraC family transcriptional regulator [Emticicia sp.]